MTTAMPKSLSLSDLLKAQYNIGVKPLNAEDYKKQLIGKEANLSKQLVIEHSLLSFHYKVKSQFLAELLHSSEQRITDEVKRQIEANLKLAELLKVIYRDYLNVPTEVHKLERDIILYHQWQGLVPQTQEHRLAKDAPFSICNLVADTTSSLNWERLLTLRGRSLVLLIAPLTSEFSQYRQILALTEPFAAPIIAYFSWLFFAPRLTVNLSMLVKHTVAGPWLTNEEKELGWQTRLQAQWNERWFLILNDAVWLSANLLNCFVLVGTAAPWGLPVALAMRGFDLVMTGIKATVEIIKMNRLRQKYQDVLNDPELGKDTQNLIQKELEQLELRMAHESKKLLLSVSCNAVLMLASLLAIPALAFHPAFPMACAAVAVTATILCFALTKWIDSQQPKVGIGSPPENSNGKGLTFFQPVSKPDDVSPAPELEPSTP